MIYCQLLWKLKKKNLSPVVSLANINHRTTPSLTLHGDIDPTERKSEGSGYCMSCYCWQKIGHHCCYCAPSIYSALPIYRGLFSSNKSLPRDTHSSPVRARYGCLSWDLVLAKALPLNLMYCVQYRCPIISPIGSDNEIMESIYIRKKYFPIYVALFWNYWFI